ncbi:MAG TPA: glycine cleavage system aminomethyltransferase GcvT [Thermoplasmata archaeon]|nr:glycine cleavage system aminomethyltransferase GcvT [Thermoplasmata archaeon]
MSGPASAPPPTPELLRTPLYSFHTARSAHMVPFAGWSMPLYYSGILDEHRAVRTAVGVFDVSHMGIVTVVGADAAALLARRTTANVARLAPGQCRYTFWLDITGAIVDDLLVTRIDDGAPGEELRFLVVPNAANATRIFELLQQHRRPSTTITAWNGRAAILAVQGPRAPALVAEAFGWTLDGLRSYTGRRFPLIATDPTPKDGALGFRFPADLERCAWVSRTGYTGEAGLELFVGAGRAVGIAEDLVKRGAVPVGLGARDSLRLEKGYLLSGQDFLRDHSPLEAGQDRFVELDHPFVGRAALEKQRKDGIPVRLAGLRVEADDAIPRHGTPVRHHGAPVGVVTSGGLSPTLHRGIALAYLPTPLAAPGTAVELEIRGRAVPAPVVPLPFVARSPART